MPAVEQLDLHLGYRFQAGATPLELALDWVAANGAVPIYSVPRRHEIPRHAFVTLRAEL